MTAPLLFSARNGVVLFQTRPVPDWVAHEAKRAINREGLEVPVEGRAFGVWLAAYEQLRDAMFHAGNQRRATNHPSAAGHRVPSVTVERGGAARPLDREQA